MRSAGQKTILITRLAKEAAEIVGSEIELDYSEMGRTMIQIPCELNSLIIYCPYFNIIRMIVMNNLHYQCMECYRLTATRRTRNKCVSRGIAANFEIKRHIVLVYRKRNSQCRSGIHCKIRSVQVLMVFLPSVNSFGGLHRRNYIFDF